MREEIGKHLWFLCELLFKWLLCMWAKGLYHNFDRDYPLVEAFRSDVVLGNKTLRSLHTWTKEPTFSCQIVNSMCKIQKDSKEAAYLPVKWVLWGTLEINICCSLACLLNTEAFCRIWTVGGKGAEWQMSLLWKQSVKVFRIPVDSVGQKTLMWSRDMCGHEE